MELDIPDIPEVSWAKVALFAMLVLNVSTEIGEYHRALEASPYWKWSDERIHQGRRAVIRASFEVILLMVGVLVVLAVGISRATEGMDGRMVLVLEGLSRLKAALVIFAISARTPGWIGIYHSRRSVRKIFQNYVCRSRRVVRFHVRCSILHHFVVVVVWLLPYRIRPLSFIIGVFAGFVVDAGIYIARRKQDAQKVQAALAMALVLAVLSAAVFANGCNYIRMVWGTGAWINEWGLRITSFSIWLTCILLVHWSKWCQKEKKLSTGRRFTVHDTNDRLAVSLILSRFLRSIRSIPPMKQLSSFSLDQAQKESDDDDDGDDGGLDLVPAKDAETSETAPSKPVNEEYLTTWSLIKMRCNMPAELGLNRTQSAITVLVSVASLFLVVVNIGSTAQMNEVKLNFPDVHTTFYERMNEGPVCAFDKIGGVIKTFDSQKAARRSGFKVAHCGACGACSDWHNLRLQYTTRKYLAAAGATCAKKSLTGGRDAVLACLQKPPVGFQGKCAECWTEDILCARRNCAFIFLQSVFINTMANFEVGPETITSATCEEAMCEHDFVPCSGANRRRMNIRSTIERPGTMLCGIVDGDWASVFGEDTLASPPLLQQQRRIIGSNEQEL